MAPTASFTSALGLMALGARTVAADCLSFGMDFQNGGSYFQNSLSNDDFTFVSQFEGCQSDSSYNILVNSTGDQVACTDTPLTPDDTNQLSTCSIEKSQLTSGNYSIVLYSNNGNGDPFNGQRDFYLSVGPQSTSTYTPTATATIVVTPVVNVTSTTTSTTTITLPPGTVTNPSITITPTTTVTPQKVTTTSTKALLTLKYTAYSVAISKVTQTKTASCHYPTRAARHDPPARIKPTVGPAARLVSAKYRREVFEEEKRRFVEERAARMALVERAPDPQPLVVTDTNTAHWPTVTSTSSAPATTATLTTEATATATITPAPVVVISGKATAAKVTVTAATPTKTVTRYTIATSVTTKTINYAYTIMSTTTPAAVKSACKTAGGIVF